MIYKLDVLFHPDPDLHRLDHLALFLLRTMATWLESATAAVADSAAPHCPPARGCVADVPLIQIVRVRQMSGSTNSFEAAAQQSAGARGAVWARVRPGVGLAARLGSSKLPARDQNHTNHGESSVRRCERRSGPRSSPSEVEVTLWVWSFWGRSGLRWVPDGRRKHASGSKVLKDR